MNTSIIPFRGNGASLFLGYLLKPLAFFIHISNSRFQFSFKEGQITIHGKKLPPFLSAN
jgi:hypothetical protein